MKLERSHAGPVGPDLSPEERARIYYEHRAAHDSGRGRAGRVLAVLAQRQLARATAAMLRATAARMEGGRG
jgi:hypothetical protein